MMKFVLLIAVLVYAQAAFIDQDTIEGALHQYSDYDNDEFSHEEMAHYMMLKRPQPAKKQTIITLNKKVRVVSMSRGVPPGWRILTLFEGKQMKNSLKRLLNTWSIVAFDKGKMDGKGYGYKISNTYGPEVGERFIVQNA